MAGDWIKMETELHEKPEVAIISQELGIPAAHVVGILHRVWSWFNKHTQNGDAPCVTETWLDVTLATHNFAHAMKKAGWLIEKQGRLTVPNFDRHNGKPAKTRALTQQRMQRKRDADTVTNASPEKRREESTNTQGAAPRKIGLPRNAEEAVEWASMENVPPDFAREVFNQMEAREWVDGAGQDVSAWRPYIAARHSKEIRGSARANGSGSSQGNAGAKPRSVWELTKQMEAKQDRIKEIHDQASHDAMGPMLGKEEKAEIRQLRDEVKELRERIAKG